MALDFLKHHSTDLERAYTAKPAKPPKDPMPGKRQKVIDGILKALGHLKAGEMAPKRGWYAGKEGVDGVRVQLKSGNKPLVIDGRDHWYVPDATKFYNDAQKAVFQGQLDDAINAAGKGGAKASTKQRAPSSSRSEAMKAAWARRKAAKSK